MLMLSFLSCGVLQGRNDQIVHFLSWDSEGPDKVGLEGWGSDPTGHMSFSQFKEPLLNTSGNMLGAADGSQ